MSILSKPNRFISTGGGCIFSQLMGTRNSKDVDGSVSLRSEKKTEPPGVFKTCQFSNHHTREKTPFLTSPAKRNCRAVSTTN